MAKVFKVRGVDGEEREYNTADATIFTDEWQRRWWEWGDGTKVPYSVMVPPEKKKRSPKLADGAPDDDFTRSLYE